MKKISTLLCVVALCIFLQSNVKSVKNSGVPPTGFAGSAGVYCATSGCHDVATVNPTAFPGTITVTGLPTGSFVPGKAYPFSIILTSTASRKIWGFSIAAANSKDSTVGVFSTTNPRAAVNLDGNGQLDELSHNNAVSKTATTYTYTNLTWTAPSTPLATPDKSIKFFYAGVAGAKSGAPGSGDYVYAGTSVVALPISLSTFTATANAASIALAWQTTSEVNSDYFQIEKSNDGQLFYSINKINAGNSANGQSYSYTDNNISYYNRPTYYRLKLVDKDGSTKYSGVVTATIKSGVKASFVKNVYPTLLTVNRPINATIESDKEQSLDVMVVDASGRIFAHYTKSLVKGNNLVSFQLTSSPAKGWVFAKFSTANNQQTMPIMISK